MDTSHPITADILKRTLDENDPYFLPRLLRLERCATELDVDVKTIRRYVAAGRLEAVRIGPRMLRVERDSLLVPR